MRSPMTSRMRALMKYQAPIVARLLLHPDERRAVGIRVERFEQVAVERIELLQANDRDVVATELPAGVEQVVVELAVAQEDALDPTRVEVVGDDALKAPFREGSARGDCASL